MLGFFTPISTKDLLHGDFQIVVPQGLEHPAKVSKSQFVCFEESLLRSPEVSPMKRGAAEHAAHREHLELDLYAVQFCPAFIPVDLRFLANSE